MVCHVRHMVLINTCIKKRIEQSWRYDYTEKQGLFIESLSAESKAYETLHYLNALSYSSFCGPCSSSF